MSLAFFYPLAWLGALAVAVPVWLHLRRLEDPHLVRFSALQFLDDQPAARHRRLWPHNWPLLLLRLLAVLLLAAAFSWPYLVSPEPASAIKESRVYILDNTLSHQSGDGFGRARDEIVDQLRQTDHSTQIAVVELTSQPRVLVRFGDSRAEGIERLQQLAASSERGSYLAAFRLADRLLRQSLGEQRQIVLAGDSQENQWDEGRSLPPFLDNVDVTLPSVSAKNVDNLALSRPVVSREFRGDRSLVKSLITLYHQGTATTAHVRYRVNEVDVLRKEVALEEQPESLTLMAEWESEPDQWVLGQVSVEGAGDALSGDNSVYFALPPVREGHLALLSESPYLRTAFSPDVMRGRWVARLLSPADLPLSEREQSNLDVLCLDARHLESPRVQQLFLDFLHGGRGAMLLVDRVTPEVARLLRPLDISFLPAAEGSSDSAGFRYVFMEHPIFRPFLSAEFGNLTDIAVRRYRRMKIPGAIPLVFADNGDPLMFDIQRTTGRLLVVAFALHRDETDWPLHATFIPFLDRCLQHVRSEITMPSEYQPGDSCVWRVPADRQVREVTWRSVEEDEAEPHARAVVDDGQARFQVPAIPGLYALSYHDPAVIEAVLAVNPSPLESQLKYAAAPDAVEAWKTTNANRKQTPDAPGLSENQSTSSILRQRVWWWLVLGGLAALVLETTCLALRKGQA